MTGDPEGSTAAPASAYIVPIIGTDVEDAAMPGMELPPVGELIDAARTAMAAAAVPRDPARAAEKRRQAASKALDRWAPAIDQLTDQIGAARFTGLTYDSVRRKRNRVRADGTREWPEPDPRFARDDGEVPRFPGGTGARKTALWTYRAIVLHLAEAPGRGHPGATLGRARHQQVNQPAGTETR